MVFSPSLHHIQDKKENSKKYFFHVMPIFTEFGGELTPLAHEENTQSDIFLWDRQTFFIAFCSLGALI
jgi:hypothetical protein